MTNLKNENEENKTTERPAVSSCGKNHACDKAETEDIEITEEMIAAGRSVISSCWLDFTSPQGHRMWGTVLTGTFQAMWAARPR